MITYVLRHRTDVDAYLRQRKAEAERIRAVIEANQEPRSTLRERLKARWEERRRAGE